MFNLDHNVEGNVTHFRLGVTMIHANCTENPFVYLIKYRD